MANTEPFLFFLDNAYICYYGPCRAVPSSSAGAVAGVVPDPALLREPVDEPGLPLQRGRLPSVRVDRPDDPGHVAQALLLEEP